MFEHVLAVALLIALTLGYGWFAVDTSTVPFEDAAMLMRYAMHTAKGLGIVWNPGEPPVDGATDMLFMLVVALGTAAGGSVETVVRLVSLDAHLATVLLVYLGMRMLQGAPLLPAWFTAAYLALGPGLYYTAAYFGTPFFGLTVALAWLGAQRLLAAPCLVRGWLWALACLVMGLARPEGVLIALFMLVAVGVGLPRRDWHNAVLPFAAVFGVLGGSYFLWRWAYFGHPLPNPYYAKGGGRLYGVSLLRAIKQSVQNLAPFLPVMGWSLLRPVSTQRALVMSISLIGSTMMWVLLSNEMNFGGRFQYPVWVMGCLSWFPLVQTLPAVHRRLARNATVLLTLVGIVDHATRRAALLSYPSDGRDRVAWMLGDYADRGYTLATTEAGLLPYRSRWRAIDTWGLNDRWIAHNGGITEAYLRLQQPDVLMWHDDHTRPPQTARDARWAKQIATLRRYATSQAFHCPVQFGITPADTHTYCVRSDLPDHDALVERLLSTPYPWPTNGEFSRNYARTAALPQP